jgi:prepilin-type N-terminal cleavage/methylation domain-containing protein
LTTTPGKTMLHPCGRGHRPQARGFTLVELLVVIAIITLLLGIAVPALGPAMASNHRMQAINALNSSMVTAQTYALSNTTDVGLRIERATELDRFGQMVRASGQGRYLDYQQIRYVIFGKVQDGMGAQDSAFRVIKDSKITALPKTIWLAPTNFLGDSAVTTDDYGPFTPCVPSTALSNPCQATGAPAVPLYPFDTFYLVFSRNGLIETFSKSKLYYMDETQIDSGNVPFIKHPHDSAEGVLMYERKKLDGFIGSTPSLVSYLSTQGQPLFVNRFLGTTVEGQ